MPILEESNIDPDDETRPYHEEITKVLDQVQGNILKGHGRDHTVHIFFRFTGDANGNKALIRDLATQVTSAQKQRMDTEARKKNGPKFLPFCNLLLTARGYKELGYSESELKQAFPEPPDPKATAPYVKFIHGMAFHQTDLSDPPVNEWESGYADSNTPPEKQQIIDGMVLLANDDLSRLDTHHQEILLILGQRASVLVTERGRAMFNKDKSQNLEHFGYVDGRSQPIFYLADLCSEQKKEGTNEWNPGAPPKLVLVEDKLAKDKNGLYYGSYFVFRKLEQNVKGFKEKERELAETLGLEGDRRELAGALAVGRFEDGTPVVLRPFDGLADPVPNNFRFDQQDPKGLKCPFHAHIRKVNPRGDTIQSEGSDAEERTHRIARRGITYGERNPEPKDDPPPESCPEKDVGLLFMCFQANIDNQFAYIQRRFADDPNFSRRETGLDPVIAQSENAPPVSQKWPVNWGNPYAKKFDFPSFVTMKGGDFFFAPSIAFLNSL